MKCKKSLLMFLVLGVLFFIGSGFLQGQGLETLEVTNDLGLWTTYTNSSSSIPGLGDYDYWGFYITAANGDQRDFQVFAQMLDGSVQQDNFTIDAATGFGSGLWSFILPGLNGGDPVYTGSSYLLEGPFVMTLAGEDREVLRVSDMPAGTGNDYYYDRLTGILVQANMDAGSLMELENEQNPPASEVISFTLQGTNLWGAGANSSDYPPVLAELDKDSLCIHDNHAGDAIMIIQPRR